VTGNVGCDVTNAAQSATDCVSVEHEKSHGSLKWISQFRDWCLLRPGQLTRKCAEALQELVWPFVKRLQDYAVTDAPNNDLALTSWKPAVSGKSNGLAATVLE
jgi:hypothetical protein